MVFLRWLFVLHLHFQGCFLLYALGTFTGFTAQVGNFEFPSRSLMKIVGFGAGGYASIPNYGLIAESTIPPERLPRHKLIQGVPF